MEVPNQKWQVTSLKRGSKNTIIRINWLIRDSNLLLKKSQPIHRDLAVMRPKSLEIILLHLIRNLLPERRVIRPILLVWINRFRATTPWTGTPQILKLICLIPQICRIERIVSQTMLLLKEEPTIVNPILMVILVTITILPPGRVMNRIVNHVGHLRTDILNNRISTSNTCLSLTSNNHSLTTSIVTNLREPIQITLLRVAYFLISKNKAKSLLMHLLVWLITNSTTTELQVKHPKEALMIYW